MSRCQTDPTDTIATVQSWPYYIYHGDRLTDEALKGQRCTAVRRPDGKCIRGLNGSMLVEFDCGYTAVVIAKLLRKIKD